MLSASGRPVLVLQGTIPAYRDLAPSTSGKDVLQLEEALKRLGFDPGPVDGFYDEQTSTAVAQWYRAAAWEPFGPTPAQLATMRTLELDAADAKKKELAAAGLAAASALAVESAKAKAEHNNRTAAAELAAKTADWDKQAMTEGGTPLPVQSALTKAQAANKVAAAEVAAKLAARAAVVADARATRAALAAADAQLELARATSLQTQLEGELAVQAARRAVKLAAEQFEQAKAAVESAKLEGEVSVRAALDAQKIAELDAKLATERAARLAADLEIARRKVGVQVPVDEIVFIPTLPVRVEEVKSNVGNVASGPVLTVTDNQLAIDSSLPLDAAPFVKPEMPVAIDEQALGIKAQGVVKRVADTPGTFGVDGYHIYFEVRVTEATTRLEGFSLRLTIPIESTKGSVLTVPISALSLSAGGTSRVQVQNGGELTYVTVEPGLSADGFVQVTPVDGVLEPGQLVVVGYDRGQAKETEGT
jgi:multidrug efflux pump subunit AcrA (membrane-fusion protein)